jgi:nucleoid-associated protein YgaU
MFVKGVIALLVAAALWGGTVHTSGAGGRERTYVVRPADTLWSIAEREYAGDPREAVWKLQERNGLDGTTLRPGQRLRLP